MVVFCCNYCGESLKKQVVDKHYERKCRSNPIFVSCMDCQKDFKNNEYDSHVKCISEMEKYSGKGYVPKASQNKGEKKQESWIELVQNVINKNLNSVQNSTIKNALNTMKTHTNCPRKESKFKNYVKSSFHLRDNESDQIWKLFENELILTRNSNNKDMKNGSKVSEIKNNLENTNSIQKEDTAQCEVIPKESNKKEKRKKNEENSVVVPETQENVAEISINGLEKSIKKKKKNKNKRTNVNDEEILIENETGKKRKQDEALENTNGNDSGVKLKKKKKNDINNFNWNDAFQKELQTQNEMQMKSRDLVKAIVAKYFQNSTDIENLKVKCKEELKKSNFEIIGKIVKMTKV